MKQYNKIKNGKNIGTISLTENQASILNAQKKNSGIKYVALTKKESENKEPKKDKKKGKKKEDK
jgi:hypothetical protein